MKKDKYIDFVLIMNIEGMHLHGNPSEGIEFISPQEDGLRFVLRPTEPDEDGAGHHDKLICKVYKSYPATEDQVLFVDSYNVRNVMLRVAEGVSLPFKPKDKVLIEKDGSCIEGFSPNRHLCPKDIKNLLDQVETDLTTQVDRLLKLIRWRQNCDDPGDILTSPSLYWRADEGNYPLAPLGGSPPWQITLDFKFGIHWSVRHSTELQALWIEKNFSEPLGHTLLREAVVLAIKSPRSSILIMTAALETAIKMHISGIVPETKWLMQEMPSPPMFKVLRDYIPIIHRSCGKDLVFWENVKPSITKVQKLIEVRNTVAHTGIIPEGVGPIENYIELVSDFLYLLDVLDGHEWAKSLVSSELRKKLGWPNPKDQRLVAELTQGY